MTDVPPGPVVTETVRPLPGANRHVGKAVTLEPLSAGHVADLWDAAQGADRSWAYLKYGPFPTTQDLAAHVARIIGSSFPSPLTEGRGLRRLGLSESKGLVGAG